MIRSRASLLLAAIAALALSACGSSDPDTTTLVQTVTQTVPATDTTALAADSTTPTTAASEASPTVDLDPESCEAKGISGDKIKKADRKEGLCVDDNGVRLKIVNRRTTLELPEINVAYSGYAENKTLSASTGTESAAGMYITVNLAVTNKLNAPVEFDPEGQVGLALGDNRYTPDFAAMNMPGDSFVWNSEELQPGTRRTGSVTFDVSNKDVKRMLTSGNINILQFSDAGSDVAAKAIGVIRTYK